MYLPTYGPELNPIELLWGDLKRSLRALALDTEEQLVRALKSLRASLPVKRIEGRFRFSLRQA